MNILDFSSKGQALIKMYETMAKEGYNRTDGSRVENAFSDFQAKEYRNHLRPILRQHSIFTVLDYGCGGSDWNIKGFDSASNQSATEYFNLKKSFLYEPARAIDERHMVDCVISFDVLEHIFISDVPSVLRDMFSYASKLIVLNIACYPAAAKLPNGENAHITVRDRSWWKGMLDSISIEYPDVSVYLLCSHGWRKSNLFPIWNANMWQESSAFVVSG